MTPQNTTTAPAPGRPTESAIVTSDSGWSVTRAAAAAEPPLTGGISASSSPAAIGVDSLTYSRLTRNAYRQLADHAEAGLRAAAASASATVAPSGSSTVSRSLPGAFPQNCEQTQLDLHRGHRTRGRAQGRSSISTR